MCTEGDIIRTSDSTPSYKKKKKKELNKEGPCYFFFFFFLTIRTKKELKIKGPFLCIDVKIPEFTCLEHCVASFSILQFVIEFWPLIWEWPGMVAVWNVPEHLLSRRCGLKQMNMMRSSLAEQTETRAV